jgi:hypothetical protein
MSIHAPLKLIQREVYTIMQGEHGLPPPLSGIASCVPSPDLAIPQPTLAHTACRTSVETLCVLGCWHIVGAA